LTELDKGNGWILRDTTDLRKEIELRKERSSGKKLKAPGRLKSVDGSR